MTSDTPEVSNRNSSGTVASTGGGSSPDANGVGKYVGFLRQSGPAFLASGLNIGTATVTNGVLLAAATGFVFGWVFFFATAAIYVATLACVKISMITKQDPIEVIRTRVHPALGWANGIAVLLVNLVFHLVNAVLAGVALNILIPGLSIQTWTVVALSIAAVMALLPRRVRIAERILKYFVFALGATYLVALFVVPVDWGAFFSGVFSFSIPTTQSQVLLFTAVLGSALAINVPIIQAYASRARGFGAKQLGLYRFETFMTNLILLFVQFAVLIVVASTLFPEGIEVTSGTQAASALEPVVGQAAATVFGLGLLGAAVTTLTVQTQVAGFVVSDLAGWKRDVGQRRFKAVQASLLAIALSIPLFNLDPFEWVTWGAAFNATFMPIGIATWWWLNNSTKIMGRHKAGWALNAGLALALIAAVTFAARFWYVQLS
jgi:manganese transport protein